ncbi:MAG TPA: YkgJ family cysteine cluster protein [Spirochaetota bacterium]|nr:YkgJ family cysteine cluster protein [Spirochaetota bacterium]
MDQKKNYYEDMCKKCGSVCCRHIALPIDKPTTKREYDEIRWYLLHKNISIYFDKKKHWYMEVRTDCKALTANGKCRIYKRRPRICRDYPSRGEFCEYEAGKPYYEKMFTSEKQFIRWLKKNQIDWQFKQR